MLSRTKPNCTMRRVICQRSGSVRRTFFFLGLAAGFDSTVAAGGSTGSPACPMLAGWGLSGCASGGADWAKVDIRMIPAFWLYESRLGAMLTGRYDFRHNRGKAKSTTPLLPKEGRNGAPWRFSSGWRCPTSAAVSRCGMVLFFDQRPSSTILPLDLRPSFSDWAARGFLP